MGASTWGGSEDLWAAMALRAVQQGHQVAAYLRRPEAEHPKIELLRTGGVTVQFCPPFAPAPLSVESLTLRAKGFFGRKPSPFDDLLRSRPEVVLINEGGFYSPADVTECAGILQASGTPYVVVCCGTDGLPPPEAASSVVAEYYARAHSVLFHAETTLKAVQRQLARSIPNARIVGDPINLPEPVRLPWPSGEAVLASVASLDARWKGQDILFEALSTPEWLQRSWRLSVFGEGNDRAYLARLVEYFGLAGRITLYGHCEDIRSVWANHHALVLPSRHESAPRALIEAMVCGRPVIAADAGGVREWLREGQNGFIAEAATARSFGLALERAWAAQDQWEHMGERGHADACAKLDPDPAGALLNLMMEAQRRNE